MTNRFSLVAGVGLFAAVLLRVAPASAAPADAALLRGAAAAGVVLGGGITLVALRYRRPVGRVHMAVIAPVIVLILTAIAIERGASGGAAADAIRVWIETARSVVAGTRFELEHAIVFAAAFWILAAFFVHATALGFPRLAAGPALAAALAVAVLERGEASLGRIAVDLALVLLVMAAASLDEHRRPRPRFRPVDGSRRNAGGSHRTQWPRILAFSTIAAVAAGTVALSIGTTIPDRTIEAGAPTPGGQITYDPFVDIFSRLDQPSDTPLFTATVAGADGAGAYFVFERLTVFTGEGFAPGLGDEATLGDDTPISQEIVIDRLGGSRLPSISGTVASSTGIVAGGNLIGEALPGLHYLARSTGPVLPGVRAAINVAPPHPITTASQAIDQRIGSEARRVVTAAGATTPLEQGAALETFLRGPSFAYAVNRYGDDLSAWLLDPGADGYRTGYCEQFALSMAVMARTVGLPSRVVIGTAPGQAQPDGSLLVLDRYAHAWVELWIEGSGWVPFDPTPRNDGVALTATAPLVTESLPDPIPGTAPEARPEPLLSQLGVERPSSQPRWPLIGFAALAGFALLAGTMAGRLRHRRARARRGSVEAAWQEIVTRLSELGAPPNPAMTPLELAGSTDTAMVPLARAFTKSAYGGGALTATETQRARESLQLTDARVTARTSKRRRLAAAFGLGALATRR